LLFEKLDVFGSGGNQGGCLLAQALGGGARLARNPKSVVLRILSRLQIVGLLDERFDASLGGGAQDGRDSTANTLRGFPQLTLGELQLPSRARPGKDIDETQRLTTSVAGPFS
jgi:hypothetical protein